MFGPCGGQMFGNGRQKNGGKPGAGNGALIELAGIRKVYDTGADQGRGAARRRPRGRGENEFVAIVGPSGSGKSTLMNIIGCLDTATRGLVPARGARRWRGLSIDRLAEIRNRRVGFVFQNFNLLPQLTAFENVEMPLLFKGTPSASSAASASRSCSSRSGSPTACSTGRPSSRAGRCSGWRSPGRSPASPTSSWPTSRRATSTRPPGATSSRCSRSCGTKGHTLVLITHDPAIAGRTKRVVHVQDGAVVSDEAVA